ncbi:MAG: response regulator [Bacteroidota bacterium]
MYKVLLADDEEGQRKALAFALEETGKQIGQRVQIVEAETSVKTRNLISNEKFDLIILDNEFKDEHIPGHLPGIALLQLARKEGVNMKTPIFFCSADTYDGLKTMTDRFLAVLLPKSHFDIDNVATLIAAQLRKGKS